MSKVTLFKFPGTNVAKGLKPETNTTAISRKDNHWLFLQWKLQYLNISQLSQFHITTVEIFFIIIISNCVVQLSILQFKVILQWTEHAAEICLVSSSSSYCFRSWMSSEPRYQPAEKISIYHTQGTIRFRNPLQVNGTAICTSPLAHFMYFCAYLNSEILVYFYIWWINSCWLLWSSSSVHNIRQP